MQVDEGAYGGFCKLKMRESSLLYEVKWLGSTHESQPRIWTLDMSIFCGGDQTNAWR